MNKTERTELRGIVRQQFRVLRKEVDQRHEEVLADVEKEAHAWYLDERERREKVQVRVNEVAAKASREVNDILREHGLEVKGAREQVWFTPPRLEFGELIRSLRVHAAARELQARVSHAKLRLDREEADLLRRLAVGALETEEARAFLETIPRVGELVPAARLAELEEAMRDE